MGEHVKVKVGSKRQIFEAGVMTGLAIAREALDGANKTFPGVGLSRALIDAEIGERRATFMLGNLKAIVNAGHDMTKIKSIASLGIDEIEAEFYDLADLAEIDEGI